MSTFTITITEINKCQVEVEAETREQALAMVEEDYFQHANDYVLEPENTLFE